MRVVRGDVFEDPCEQIIAGEYADAIAEVDRGRVDAATAVGAVDDVVMNQRADVDQFHVCRQRQVRRADRHRSLRAASSRRRGRSRLPPAASMRCTASRDQRIVGRKGAREKTLRRDAERSRSANGRRYRVDSPDTIMPYRREWRSRRRRAARSERRQSRLPRSARPTHRHRDSSSAIAADSGRRCASRRSSPPTSGTMP